MKKLFLFAFGIIVGIVILTLLLPNSKSVSDTTKNMPTLSQSMKKATVTIGTYIIHTDVADTDSLRTQGLSGRNELSKDSGMLFLFPSAGMHSFWMKEMNFPLDFIWMKDGKIMDITTHVPNPNPGESNLPLYTPKEPVDAVLEVSSGVVDEHGIDKDDTVVIKML